MLGYKNIPGCDTIIHPRRPRRRPSKNQWASWLGHILIEHAALPPDSPRRTPTLPRLRFLEKECAA
jgi:hypothetical protein